MGSIQILLPFVLECRAATFLHLHSEKLATQQPHCIVFVGEGLSLVTLLSISAESRITPPVPPGFELWAWFCEVWAIALVQQRRKTDPVLVSEGSTVCSGFWWLFKITIFVLCFFFFYRGVIPCTLADRMQNKNQISFICRKSLLEYKELQVVVNEEC